MSYFLPVRYFLRRGAKRWKSLVVRTVGKVVQIFPAIVTRLVVSWQFSSLLTS